MKITTLKVNQINSRIHSATDLINLKNSLIEFKKNGGDTTCALDILIYDDQERILSESNFSNPLLMYLSALKNYKSKFSEQMSKEDLLMHLKDFIDLSYDNIDQYFDWYIDKNDNTIKMRNPLSEYEMGALITAYPEKTIPSFKRILKESVSYYLDSKREKITEDSLYNDIDNDNFLLNYEKILKIEEYSNVENGLIYYQNSNKFITKTKKVYHFPLFQIFNNNKLISKNNKYLILQNQEFFEKIVLDSENDINTIVENFSTEEKKMYEHYLFENFPTKVSQRWNFLLLNNKDLKPIVYDMSKSISEQEEYSEYLNYFLAAIRNNEYDFLERNLKNFDIDSFKLFQKKKECYSLFFNECQNLDMIKFLESKGFPVFDENGYYLSTSYSVKNLKNNIDYLKYNPKAYSTSVAYQISNSFLDSINKSIDFHNVFVPDGEDATSFWENFFTNTYSKYFEFFKDIVVPNEKEHFELLINKTPYLMSFNQLSLSDRFQTIGLLKSLEKNTSTLLVKSAINSLLLRCGYEKKIATGIIMFLKNQKYDLRDPIFLHHLTSVTSITREDKKRLLRDESIDYNKEYNDLVSWWVLDIADKYLQINYQAKNKRGLNIFSYYLEECFTRKRTVVLDKLTKNIGVLLNNNEIVEISAYSCSEDRIPDFVKFVNTIVENSLNSNENNAIEYVNKMNVIDRINSFNFKHNLSNINSILSPYYSNRDLSLIDDSKKINIFNETFNDLLLKSNLESSLPVVVDAIKNDNDKIKFLNNILLVYLLKINDELEDKKDLFIEKFSTLFSCYPHFNNEVNLSLNLDLSNFLSLKKLSANNIIQDFASYKEDTSNILNKNCDLTNLFPLIYNEMKIKNPTIDLKTFKYVDDKTDKVVVHIKFTTNIANLIDGFCLINVDKNDVSKCNGEQQITYQRHREERREVSQQLNRYIYEKELSARFSSPSNVRLKNKI